MKEVCTPEKCTPEKYQGSMPKKCYKSIKELLKNIYKKDTMELGNEVYKKEQLTMFCHRRFVSPPQPNVKTMHGRSKWSDWCGFDRTSFWRLELHDCPRADDQWQNTKLSITIAMLCDETHGLSQLQNINYQEDFTSVRAYSSVPYLSYYDLYRAGRS